MNILITGTSRGLGLYLGEALFEQGHTIIGLSRTETNHLFPTYKCDISDYSSICTVCYDIFCKYKYIDVLINNAGIIIHKPLSKYTLEDINDILDINIKGTFLISQYMAECMQDQESGYIINIGSTRSITSAPNKSLYSMSKFAIRALTQSINIEYNKYNVYSTLLCPGAIKDDSMNLDILKTINYLMYSTASIPEVIIGGQL